ncbi:sulfite exporter TauE/SafE family protein [Caminibacter sp.]
METYVLTILSGLLSGLALGLTGGGGSILAVPLLVYLVGIDIHLAIVTSLIAVGATSLISSLTYMRDNLVRFKTAFLMAAPGLISTYLGSLVNKHLNGHLLLVLFSFLMFYIGYRMTKKRKTPEKAGKNYLKIIILGFVVGFASGLFGVGGGFLLVPALYMGANLSMKESIGTSLFIIFLFGLFGMGSYIIQHRPINFLISAVFVIGGVVGGYIGAKIGENLDQQKLRLIFAYFTMAMAVFIFLENIFKLI